MVARRALENIQEEKDNLADDSPLYKYYDKVYDYAWLMQIRAASKLQELLDGPQLIPSRSAESQPNPCGQLVVSDQPL